jgi:hypothetical protein
VACTNNDPISENEGDSLDYTSFFVLDEFEDGTTNGWTKSQSNLNGMSVTYEDKYCGDSALYLETGNAKKSGFWSQHSIEWHTADSPYLCFAYNIPSDSRAERHIQLAGHMYEYVVLMSHTSALFPSFMAGSMKEDGTGDTISRDNTWRYTCMNMHASLLKKDFIPHSTKAKESNFVITKRHSKFKKQ